MRITLSKASGNNSRESNMGNGKMECGEKISTVNELKSCGQHQIKKNPTAAMLEVCKEVKQIEIFTNHHFL